MVKIINVGQNVHSKQINFFIKNFIINWYICTTIIINITTDPILFYTFTLKKNKFSIFNRFFYNSM